MNRNLRKTTLREIKNSFGRYIAILAITALGVGFFGGLKICTPAMINIGNQYLEETEFYDYRLISTYGFEEEDVQSFAGLDEVMSAEGSFSYDVIYEIGENIAVAKVHSITEQLNLVEVTDGRMPEAPDECLLDSSEFSSDVIGSELVFSSQNDEDTLDTFIEKTYTVVGLAQSPNYLNYERGTTALLDGTVGCFIYVPREAVDSDIYTEVYVRLQNRYDLYSDEYNDYIDSVTDTIESVTKEAGERRYQAVIDEYTEELADAEKELADAKEEGIEELADAYEQLLDGQRELADGREELFDGIREIEDAKIEIEDARQTIADGWIEVEDGRTELLDGEEELAEGIAELNDAAAELADARQQLTDAQQEIDDARYQIANGFAQIAEKEEELAEARALLDDNGSQVSYGMGMIDGGLLQVEDALSARPMLEEGIAAYRQAVREAVWAQMVESVGGREDLIPSWMLEEMLEKLESETEKVLQGDMQYQGLVSTLAQIPTVEELNSQKHELVTMQDYLYSQYLLCLDAANQLNYAEQQLALAKGELYQAQADTDAGEIELWRGLVEYADGVELYREAEAEILDARQKLDDGWQELNDAIAELEDGERELRDAEIELLDAEQKIEDGRTEIADGQYELEHGFREYYLGRAEFDRQIAKAEEELADAKEELADLKPAETFVLDRGSNVGIVCFESDTQIVEAVSVVFPVFFFLVVALVCITTMNRMIEEQRTQIGVLKAMGYTTGAIMGKYLFYAGSAATIGGLLGFFAGTYTFPTVIWTGYNLMYGFAQIEYVFDPMLAILSLLVALLCTMGATWFSCIKELKSMPAELIRPKAPKAGKRIFLEYITVLWKRLPFLHKVSLRNIFRYKKRFFMMIIGISGCTALLLTGFGFQDSIADIIGMQYAYIEVYDLGIMLNEEPDEEEKAEFEETADRLLSEYTYIYSGTIDAISPTMMKSVNLVIPSDEEAFTNYIILKDGNGETVELPGEGEVILSHKIADKMGLKIGDTFTLRDSDMNEITVTLSGTYKNYIYNYAIISEATYQEAMGELPEYKNLYANVEDGVDLHNCAAELLNLDEVMSVTVNQDIMERVGGMMGNLKYIVLLVIGCAAMLAFIVLYNLTNINITERIREIATIKVLGFYSMETANYVFRENVILTAMGAAVGLLMGIWFHGFVIDQIDIDLIAFDKIIQGASYVYSYLLTLAFALMVNGFMYFKLNKINMAESLKSVE